MPKTHADGVYTRADRKGFWISWRGAGGRRRIRKTNAPTLQQARMALAEEKRRVEQARVLGTAAPTDASFADVAARYLRHQKPRLTPKAFTRAEGVLRLHIGPFFTGRLAAIRRADVQRFVTARAAEISAYTVQKELNILKHLFRLAVEWELLPVSPAEGVSAPRQPAGRVRYLQPGELAAVAAASPGWLQRIVALAVSTGMRRGEILGLRWMDVDMAHGRILLPQSKNGEGRIVYLNQTASAALAMVQRDGAGPAEMIWPAGTPERVSIAFARAVKAAGIANFRFHDLRHCAASWMRMRGADTHTVAQMLGHKDMRMAARYQHLSPAFMADAVASLDGVFGAALALPPAPATVLPASKYANPCSPGATGFLAAKA